MITLKSDNRVLTSNAKFSYLTSNSVAGLGILEIISTEGFSVDDFILIGEFGQEDAEFFRAGTVDTTLKTLTLLTSTGVGTTTKFAHPESTRVTVLPYNQLRFYWTPTTGTISDEVPVFDTNIALTAWIPLEPGNWYTTYSDSEHTTGFGWFLYRNSITFVASSNSNAIPYAGFNQNTVAAVFADFESLLNTNELKLISITEKYSWLNEALAVLKNKLNLTNTEYTVSTEQSISVVANTAEYQLQDDFSDMVEINDGTNSKIPIPFMSISLARSYTGNVTHYYLRNRYIGFVPMPGSSSTVKYVYRAKATRATSLSTYIDLPDNAFFALKDWMAYRAYLKFNNPISNIYYTSFTNSVNLFVQSAVKRDASLDVWGIEASSNV